LITLLKPIIEGLRSSLKLANQPKQMAALPRTEQDLSPKWMLVISGVIIAILILTFNSFIGDSGLSASLAWMLVIVTVLFAFVLGFLISAACGYMAGLVGSSASPISGIGIIAVTLVSLILLVIGQQNHLLDSAANKQFLTALAIFSTSVVFAIASISNDNLQD